MKFRVPRTLQIGAIPVRIFYEKGLDENHGKLEQCRFSKAEIAIDPEGTDEIKTNSLYHGLIHWIDFVYNDYQLNEHETSALSTGLGVLLNNLGVKLNWSEVK